MFVAAKQDSIWIFIWKYSHGLKFTAAGRWEYPSQTKVLIPSHSHVQLYKMFLSLPCKWRQHISKTNPFKSVMDYSLSFFFLFSSFQLGIWQCTCLTFCSAPKQNPYSLTKARQNDQKTSQAQSLRAKKVVFTTFWEHGGFHVNKRAAWRSQACSAI